MIESAFLTDESKWLGSALFAMGRSWDQRWKPQVLEMLDNPFPRIRFEAARAAGKLEILDAVPFLLELLEDDDEEVRSASIWSLSQIGGEGVEEALNNLIKLTDDETDSALDNLVFTEGLPLHDLGNLTLGPNQ